jgi:hypothetical protein
LYNITDSIVAGYGMNSLADPDTNAVATNSDGGAPIIGGKNYRIEHYCGTTGSFGNAISQGTEVYARTMFTPT